MKLNIARIFEASKVLATKAGAEITDFVEFSSSAFEQLIRALRNQLTFTDNFFCQDTSITVSHNVATNIDIGNKRAIGILPLKVNSQTYGVDFYMSYYDSNGNFTVKIGLTDGSNPPTDSLSVRVIIFFE